MTTSLTLYNTNASSTTLSTTAKTLIENPSTGATSTNLNTNLTANTTGWIELWSFGNASAQTGAGSEPSPSAHGWIDDQVTLEGNHFVSGNWTWTVEIETTATGTFVCDIHCRSYQRSSGGTYTLITEGTLTGQTVISTAYTQYTITSIGAAASNTFSTGDKLYTDVLLNITSNSTSSNMRVHMSSSSTLGYSSVSLVSPGYIAVTTSTRTIPSTLALMNTSTRTIPSTLSLNLTRTRTIPATIALLGNQRTIPTTIALWGTSTRTIPASLALNLTSIRTIPAALSLYQSAIFYASNVASTAGGLTQSEQMSRISGGTETSFTVTMPSSGTNNFVEIVSQGGVSAAT